MKIEVQNYLLKLVQKNYQETAAAFDKSRQKLWWPELLNLVRELRPGQKVLDVGCGNGRLLEVLQDKQVEYLGVDNSLNLITLAKKNYPNYNFLVGDILHLDDLLPEKFDYLFCIAVLHHVPGTNLQIQALKQMANRLQDSGQLVVSVWNLWSRIKFFKLIIKSSWRHFWGLQSQPGTDLIFPGFKNASGQSSQRYYHAFTKRELKKISRQANLKVKSLYQDRFNYYLILEKN